MERFPANEEVEGELAFEDPLQLLLEVHGVCEAVVGPGHAVALFSPLEPDPVVQVGVGERFEGASALPVGTRKPMIVDEGMESVQAPVPDVPDEGAVMEQLAVLGEELVAKPDFERPGNTTIRVGGCEQPAFGGSGPLVAVRANEKRA